MGPLPAAETHYGREGFRGSSQKCRDKKPRGATTYVLFLRLRKTRKYEHDEK